MTTAFLIARWKGAARCAGDLATMTLLLRHFRRAQVIATSPPAAICGDIALIAQEYEEFLLEERSLVRSSANQ